MRESRVGTFDQQRGAFGSGIGDDGAFTDDDRALIGTVIKDELRDLNVDLALQDQIAAELSEEAFAWSLADRGQRELDYVEQLLGDGSDGGDDGAVPFFCPICQTTVLQPVFDHYACERCALRLRPPAGVALHQLQYNVLRKVVEHERRAPAGCEATVTFFAEPVAGSDFAVLNMFCESCDFYATFRPSD